MEEKTPSIESYAALLASIKERIQTAQVRAALAVNQELVLLYWGIGHGDSCAAKPGRVGKERHSPARQGSDGTVPRDEGSVAP